jgi:hypothetical protein
LIRLLMIFYKFNENFKGKLKWWNWVFIELNKYSMKMKSEVTWFGHAWLKNINEVKRRNLGFACFLDTKSSLTISSYMHQNVLITDIKINFPNPCQ